MAASGDIWQATYVGIYAGQRCENVIHYRALTGLVPDADVFTAMQRFLLLTAGMQSNNYLYDTIIAKRMTPIALDEHILVASPTTHGTASGSDMNSTISAILTLRTGTAGKSHRGRIYFGGVVDGSVNGGQNTLSTVGALRSVTAANGLLSEFGPSGSNTALALGIYSRAIGGVHPFTLAGWQQVSGIDPQTILGNQRRRRVGVGI